MLTVTYTCMRDGGPNAIIYKVLDFSLKVERRVLCLNSRPNNKQAAVSQEQNVLNNYTKKIMAETNKRQLFTISNKNVQRPESGCCEGC